MKEKWRRMVNSRDFWVGQFVISVVLGINAASLAHTHWVMRLFAWAFVLSSGLCLHVLYSLSRRPPKGSDHG